MHEGTRYPRANAAAYQAMKAMQGHVDGTGLDPELVKLRASYMNGYVFRSEGTYRPRRSVEAGA